MVAVGSGDAFKCDQPDCAFLVHADCAPLCAQVANKPLQISETLRCRKQSHISKQEAGHLKYFVASECGQDQQPIQAEFQFCNSCDQLIMFKEVAFYTCPCPCDLFICLTCAQCPSGHALGVCTQKLAGLRETVSCSKCQSVFIPAETHTLPANLAKGYHRCDVCNYELCRGCRRLFSNQ